MQPPIVPIGGTPILPPSYLTAYFGVFLLFLGALYLYFYRKNRPSLLWQKVKLLIVLAFVLKATVLLGGGLLAAYWLIPTPGITRTLPQKSEASFSTTNKIEIIFDRPISRGLLERSISPETPGIWVFENSVYTTHLYRKLVFYPTFSLRPNTGYTIKLAQIRNLLNISKPYDYTFDFTTQKAPKVVAVAPVSGQNEVDLNSKIEITLDNPNDNVSEFEFKFTPTVEFETTLDASKTMYTLTPKTDLTPGTQYNLKIYKSDIVINLEDSTVVERGGSEQQYDGNFKTKQGSDSLLENITRLVTSNTSIKVTSISPKHELSAVSIHAPIRISFDQDVNRTTIQQKFSIAPEVAGDFSWDGNTMTFIPQEPLAATTAYTVTLDNLAAGEDFVSMFTTQNSTTKLNVPHFMQKYTLSCEIAALRMALSYKGVNVSEDEIIPKVGQDPTPHTGNVWGDPNKAFVGNIRGTQMKDGYGVHWAPIAKAARTWREAQDFEGWSIGQLTAEIVKDNPIVIWVYSHHGNKTSWTTPDGTTIAAVRDEHAVTVVGFVGPSEDPTQIIINDPLIGQVYLSRAAFNSKWGIFNNSGVVVY